MITLKSRVIICKVSDCHMTLDHYEEIRSWIIMFIGQREMIYMYREDSFDDL